MTSLPERRPIIRGEQVYLRPAERDDVPTFRAGDTIKVHVKVVEGNRSRVQVFQGVVSVIAGIIAFVWPGVTVLARVLPIPSTLKRTRSRLARL